MIEKRMIIIDGNSLVNRAFYALPSLTNKEGQHTNAIYGFLTMLFRVLDDYKPEYIGVAFDKKAPTFRHRAYTDYKAGRKGMPAELAEQMEPLKDVLDALNIFRIEMEGFEADDLIGTLAKHCEDQEFESLIVTGDRDALQLASTRTKILFTKRGITNLEIYDDKKVMEEYEVTPLQFIDLKGLMGDKSDNIPGIPGVGEKTAQKLLKQFDSIENLIQNTDQISGAKLKERVEENTQQAILSKKLATIVTNVPVEINLEDLRLEEFNREKTLDLFNKYEFNTLINRLMEFNKETDNLEDDISIIPITTVEKLQGLKENIYEAKQIVFLAMTKEKNIVEDEILALAITVDGGDQYYIDTRDFDDNNQLFEILKEIMEDESIEKISHNIKNELLAFYAHNINMRNIRFDTMIGEYLLDPSKTNYDIKDLAAKYLATNLPDEEELRGKGRSKIGITDVPMDELKDYLCQHSRSIYNILKPMQDNMEELELMELYEEVELPLIEVLAAMEFRGIKVDKNMLEDLKIEFEERVNTLTDEIHNLAGTDFNINSPKQLGEILFTKLELPPIRKTKTGYSTSVEVLEKLYDKHEIIPKILDYRQITKLKSTYIDGLLKIINPLTGRIHSTFNQTVTATGRISSTEPNLQNIPIRLEMGRQIRKVFIAEKNHKFIDADYSQIELRVLAHISEDKNLLESFKLNQDIHRRTASEIFDIPMEEVTDEMRENAKAVNFGIIYGISDFGLSENLKISRYDAKKYIDNYLKKYSNVEKYMSDAVETAKEKGYVLTLLNRRRYLPEVNSRNFNIRSFGERMAMNTPIQGTAADIIKVAMVKVFNKLKDGDFKSKLILQVHDELIVECPEEELDQVSKIVKESMEEAIELKVELKVDLAYGITWYDV